MFVGIPNFWWKWRVSLDLYSAGRRQGLMSVFLKNLWFCFIKWNALIFAIEMQKRIGFRDKKSYKYINMTLVRSLVRKFWRKLLFLFENITHFRYLGWSIFIKISSDFVGQKTSFFGQKTSFLARKPPRPFWAKKRPVFFRFLRLHLGSTDVIFEFENIFRFLRSTRKNMIILWQKIQK